MSSNKRGFKLEGLTLTIWDHLELSKEFSLIRNSIISSSMAALGPWIDRGVPILRVKFKKYIYLGYVCVYIYMYIYICIYM